MKVLPAAAHYVLLSNSFKHITMYQYKLCKQPRSAFDDLHSNSHRVYSSFPFLSRHLCFETRVLVIFVNFAKIVLWFTRTFIQLKTKKKKLSMTVVACLYQLITTCGIHINLVLPILDVNMWLASCHTLVRSFSASGFPFESLPVATCSHSFSRSRVTWKAVFLHCNRTLAELFIFTFMPNAPAILIQARLQAMCRANRSLVEIHVRTCSASYLYLF